MAEGIPQELKNWGAYEQIYDTCNIGPDIDTKVNGWYETFTQMANAPEIPFLNVRNESIAGQTYTNITSMDKVPWWFELNSIGLRFLFPDPHILGASEHPGLSAMSKFFQQVLPEHAFFEFKIRSYTFLKQKASQLPDGYGTTGQMQVNTAANNSFHSLMHNGSPEMLNRWKMLRNENIPKDTPISGRLVFDDYARNIFRIWDSVPAIDFGAQDLTGNMCQIVLTLRGIRYEQRPGEFRQ